MKTRRVIEMHRNLRGVIEVIMTVSLISIAVTASVFIYNLSAGIIAGANRTAGQRVEEDVIMEAYNFPVSGALTISFRNIGEINVSLSIADFFFNGLPASADNGCKITLTTGRSCATSITVQTSTLSAGTVYPLRIVSSNVMFSYPVTYGRSG